MVPMLVCYNTHDLTLPYIALCHRVEILKCRDYDFEYIALVID